MSETTMLYTAVYDSVDAALTDLDALKRLHDEELIGKYDAAVIDQEDGRPHIVKRVDRPAFRIIPELFGGGALPRGDLHTLAQELSGAEAALVAVGEPTIERGLDKAVTNAAKIAKRSFDTATDELVSMLQEAAKEQPPAAR